jgi:hypothetical protein
MLALKILINGGYGVFGDNRYDCYDPRVAELVTSLGRQALCKRDFPAFPDISLDACSNVFALLTPILENSFT